MCKSLSLCFVFVLAGSLTGSAFAGGVWDSDSFLGHPGHWLQPGGTPETGTEGWQNEGSYGPVTFNSWRYQPTQHSVAGYFAKTDTAGHWSESTTDGRLISQFVETQRDSGSVYLYDQARNMRIRLSGTKAYFAIGNGAWQLMYYRQ